MKDVWITLDVLTYNVKTLCSHLSIIPGHRQSISETTTLTNGRRADYRSRNPLPLRLTRYVLAFSVKTNDILNPLNAELNPVCHLLALLAAHHILHVSRIRVNTGSKKWGAGVNWLEFIL